MASRADGFPIVEALVLGVPVAVGGGMQCLNGHTGRFEYIQIQAHADALAFHRELVLGHDASGDGVGLQRRGDRLRVKGDGRWIQCCGHSMQCLVRRTSL